MYAFHNFNLYEMYILSEKKKTTIKAIGQWRGILIY